MVVSEMKLSRREREYLWAEVTREISLNNLIRLSGVQTWKQLSQWVYIRVRQGDQAFNQEWKTTLDVAMGSFGNVFKNVKKKKSKEH